MSVDIASFLAEQPLYSKQSGVPDDQHEFEPVSLTLYCSSCKRTNPFRKPGLTFVDRRPTGSGLGTGSPPPPPNTRSGIHELEYFCAGCAKESYRFWIEVDTASDWIRKIGQIPPFQIGTPQSLASLLAEHEAYFKKGLISESQSFGIGAYAYYRRIVEEVIDELLKSIAEVVDPSEKERYQGALESIKEATVARDKIDLVKDLLPSVLRPSGINPLGVLYGTLSDGLHGRSDAECLESAQQIRESLVFLVDQVRAHQDSSKRFTEAMRKLLDAKAAREA